MICQVDSTREFSFVGFTKFWQSKKIKYLNMKEKNDFKRKTFRGVGTEVMYQSL